MEQKYRLSDICRLRVLETLDDIVSSTQPVKIARAQIQRTIAKTLKAKHKQRKGNTRGDDGYEVGYGRRTESALALLSRNCVSGEFEHWGTSGLYLHGSIVLDLNLVFKNQDFARRLAPRTDINKVREAYASEFPGKPPCKALAGPLTLVPSPKSQGKTHGSKDYGTNRLTGPSKIIDDGKQFQETQDGHVMKQDEAFSVLDAIQRRLLDSDEDYGMAASEVKRTIGDIRQLALHAIVHLFNDAIIPPSYGDVHWLASMVSVHLPDLGNATFGMGNGLGLPAQRASLVQRIATVPHVMKDTCQAILMAFVTTRILHLDDPAGLGQNRQQGFHEEFLGKEDHYLLMFHRKLTRQSTSKLVNEKSFKEREIAPEAERLMQVFNHKIGPILGQIIRTMPLDSHARWDDRLRNLFELSLLVVCKIHPGQDRFSFELPPSGCRYDPARMDTEDEAAVMEDSQFEYNVALAFSPTVILRRIRTTAPDAGLSSKSVGGSLQLDEETVISKAFVKLCRGLPVESA